MLHSAEPEYSHDGVPHLMVSFASGHASSTMALKCVRIGFAKSPDFAM